MMQRFVYALILLLPLAGCSSEKVDVMVECASPGGKSIATLYRVSTGTRPGDQEMRLNIRPAKASFDDGMYSFAFQHGYDGVIAWHGDKQITLSYPKDSVLMHQEMVVFGSSQTFDSEDTIQMRYQEKPSIHGYFMVEKRCFQFGE